MECVEYCVPSATEFNVRVFLETLRQCVERVGGRSVVSSYWGVFPHEDAGKFSKEFMLLHPRRSNVKFKTLFRSGDFVYEFVFRDKYFKLDLSRFPNMNRVTFTVAPLVDGIAFEEMESISINPYPSLRLYISELEKAFDYNYVCDLSYNFFKALVELVDFGIRYINKLDFTYERVSASNKLGFIYKPVNRVMICGFQYV